MRFFVLLLAATLLCACATETNWINEFPPKPGDTSGSDRNLDMSGCVWGGFSRRKSLEDDVADCMEAKGYRWTKRR